MSDTLQGIIVAIICIAAIVGVIRKIFSKRSGCSCGSETGHCEKKCDCENPECQNCIHRSPQPRK